MRAVQVPAELVARLAERFAELHMAACGEFHDTYISEMPTCDKGNCPADRAMTAELRALLPQPEPATTCPDPACGHPERQHHDGREHDGYGIQGCDEDDCLCIFTAGAIRQVRALLAAEGDSKPAPAKPRVWRAGDPEPDDVTKVSDRDGDVWDRDADGWWHSPETRECRWEHIARKWAPLTEVLPGGAR